MVNAARTDARPYGTVALGGGGGGRARASPAPAVNVLQGASGHSAMDALQLVHELADLVHDLTFQLCEDFKCGERAMGPDHASRSSKSGPSRALGGMTVRPPAQKKAGPLIAASADITWCGLGGALRPRRVLVGVDGEGLVH